MQNFRQLLVWRKAHALAIEVHRSTGAFPRKGHGNLRSQLVRCAESIPANIVEGCFAATQKEFARFLDISIKSSGEVEYHVQLARDHRLIPVHRWRTLTSETVDVRRMLVGLRRKVLEAEDRPPRKDAKRPARPKSAADGQDSNSHG